MIDLADDCAAAATELINRGRDEALLIATLRQQLVVNQAIAAAIFGIREQRAGKPRRNRTIRVVYDDDGVAIGTEDVEPAPAGMMSGRRRRQRVARSQPGRDCRHHREALPGLPPLLHRGCG
jgi:hypothetical protein